MQGARPFEIAADRRKRLQQTLYEKTQVLIEMDQMDIKASFEAE